MARGARCPAFLTELRARLPLLEFRGFEFRIVRYVKDQGRPDQAWQMQPITGPTPRLYHETPPTVIAPRNKSTLEIGNMLLLQTTTNQ